MTPRRIGFFAKRPVKWAVRIVLIGTAVYLLLANLLLNTAALEPLVNRKPESFTMRWQRGVMLWPGRVTLWNVSMGGHARRTLWSIEADRATGRIAIMPLLRKELRFASIRAVSPVITADSAATERVPLQGEHGLRLVFDDVRVDSPLTFSRGDLIIKGHAQARARWHQQLRGGPFELLPSTIRLDGAVVSKGGRTFLEGLELSGEARIDEHHRRDYPGRDILQLLSVDADLRGEAPGVFVEIDEELKPHTRRHEEAGPLSGRLVLDHGDLGDKTALDLSLPIAVVGEDGLDVSGDARISLHAEDEALALDIVLPPVPELVQRAEMFLRLDGRAMPLPPWGGQLQRLGGEIDLDSRFSSLRWVRPLLARLRGFDIDGSGAVKGHIVLDQGQLAAGTQLSVSDAAFSLQAYSHRFDGKAHAEAKIEPHDNDASALVAQMTLDSFDIAPAGKSKAVLGSGRNLRLDIVADGRLSELRDRLDAHLYFSDASLPDISRFNRYLPKGSLRFLSGTGKVGADMHMSVATGRNDGELSLAASAAALRLGELVLRSDLDIHARLAAADLEDRHFQLPGTRVSVRRAAILEPEGERVENWWLQGDITRGQVSFGQPMELAAEADVMMRDVAPLLAMFAQHKHFPRWIRRLIDAGEATVHGEMQMNEDCLVFDPVQANNERFDVAARMRLCEKKPSGQLYASWGILGLGVELDKGERKFHLAGAKKWFEEHVGAEKPP